MTKNTITILVCSDCAAGIANDDWTHLDACGDAAAADEAMSSIMGWLELTGYLTLSDSNADSKGYFTCPCCSAVTIDGATFTTETAKL